MVKLAAAAGGGKKKKAKTKAKTKVKTTIINWSTHRVKKMAVMFTAALAQDYNGLPAFAIERPLDKSYVAELVAAMEGGQFLTEQAALSIAVCAWDGKERKLNGQHIANARMLCNGAIKFPKIDVIRYQVKTVEEYRNLYIYFDSGKNRTASHKAKMLLYATPEYQGIAKYVFPILAAGAKIWHFKQRVYVPEVCYALRYEFPTIGRDVAELLSYAYSISDTAQMKLFKRSPIIAAMFETCRVDSVVAREFWTTMLGADFSGVGDVRSQLRDYLSRSAIGYTKFTQSDRVSLVDMYNFCIACFKAFRAGGTVTKAPKSLRGERLTGD